MDLYGNITNNTTFRKKLEGVFSELRKLDPLVRKGVHGTQQKRDKLLLEILQMCDWNMGILFPIFFPRMIEGGPLNMMRRPFSFMMTELQVEGFTAVRGSRQIAKSTSFVGRQMIKAILYPRVQSLYICPHPHHKKTYADRFRAMEAECAFHKAAFPKGTALRNNLFYKEYSSGSTINIVNCLTDTSQARSKSADELLYDEYQLFDISLEGDIDQCLSVSKIPMRVYAGTSTTVDSPLEHRYQQGSQNTWKVRSPNGTDWIDFGDSEQLEKCIRPKGLTCPFTNRPLNVRDGGFTPTFAEREKFGYRSVHVPQLIIADRVEDRLEWEKIHKAFKEYERPKFMEEVAGIPSEMGAREITENDLKKICVLGSKRDVEEKVRNHYYSMIVSGNDWGGSDHIVNLPKSRVSHTVHLMLGLAPDGHFDIIHMRRYDGLNYDEITQCIVQDHKRYLGNAMAADAMGGQVYLNQLDKALNLRTNFRFNYHSGVHQMLGVPGHGALNHFTLNKHESISQLFKSIKDQRIRCFNWEEAAFGLSEILNIQRVLYSPQNGPDRYHYHMTPNKPDDMVQALNYANTLMRLLIGENVAEDDRVRLHLMSSLAGAGIGIGSGMGSLSSLFDGDV
jgi:hypothetical protein